MNKFLFNFIISISLLPLTICSFTSLKDANNYAKSVEEYPEINNNNWLNPLFTSFEKSLVPNFFSRSLSRFGLTKPLWSPTDLKQLLIQVTKQRELNGDIGRFVRILETKGDESFFIWGDLHGAFHSFVRDLNYLQAEGVIDNSFKIIGETNYFVFNGNAIDQSPFSPETVTLILNLMRANPQKVFYVRGSHEDKQAWHDQNLGSSLTMRAFSVSNEKIPLDTEFTNFFNSLPLALYLKGVGAADKISFVRISPSNRQNNEIDEKKFAGFLANQVPGKTVIHLNDKDLKSSEKPLTMVAIIKDEDRANKFTQTAGLALHDPEDGATSWSVLSAGSGTYRRKYDFFFDAFAVLRTAPMIHEWTISLYNRDVRGKNDFNISKIYNLSSGKLLKEIKSSTVDLFNVSKELIAAESKVQKLESSIADIQKEISKIKEGKEVVVTKALSEPQKIAQPQVVEKKETEKAKSPVTQQMLTFGSTMDLSKGGKPSGTQLKASVEAFLNDIEKAGKGIDGIIPKVIFSDDEYNPEKARENIIRFIEQGLDKTFLCWGSATIEKYLDLVREKKIAVFFPVTGASVLRNADLTNVINLRGSFEDEAKILISYAIERKKAKKIAIFYQNDVFGQTGLKGALQFAQEKKIDYQKEWILIPYERNDLNLSTQAEKLKQENPDAILFCSIVNITKELIHLLGESFFEQKQLLALSSFGEKEFTDYISQIGLKFVIASSLPNLITSKMEIAQECRELMKKHNIELDIWAFEGFVSISLLFDALKKIEGPITKESIIKQFESMKNVNYKGLELDFNPKTRELSKYIWLNTGEAEWEKYTIERLEKKDKISSKQAIKVSQATLTFGSTLPLSGGERVGGNQFKTGVSLFLKKMREENETINGIIPKIIFLDDEYTPALAKKNTEHFLKDGIDKTICSYGTPTLSAYLDLVKQKKIAVFFPGTGASVFRTPEYPYIISLETSYANEIKVAIDHAIDFEKAKKIAFFIENDEFGKGAFEGAKLAAQQRNIDYKKEWQEVYYERSEVNLADQANDINTYDPDAIIFLANPIAAKELIRLLGASYLIEKKLLGLHGFGQEVFKEFIRERGLHFIITNTMPNPKESTIGVVKEFREYALKNNIALDALTFDGYLSMAVMVDTIKKIKGEITTESIIAQLEQIKDYNYKGLNLNFNNKTRELMHDVWVDTGEGDWKQYPVEGSEDKTMKSAEKKAEPTKTAPQQEAKKIISEKEAQSKESGTKDLQSILTFGSSLDLTNGWRFAGEQVQVGMSLYLQKLREENANIKGVFPKIVVVNDGYTPSIAKQNVEHFIGEGINKLFCPLGTPTLEAYIDLIKQQKIAAFFPVTGTSMCRDPNLTYVINLRNSYLQETKALVEHALDVDKLMKLVFFVQDDSYGKAALEGALLVAKSRKIDYEKEWKIIYYARESEMVTGQAEEINKYNPDALILLAIPVRAKNLITSMDTTLLSRIKLFATSPMGEAVFRQFIKDRGLKMIVSSVMPNPNDTTIEFVNEFREYAKDHNIEIDTNALEGYLGMAVLVDTIKKISGEINTNSIIAQFEQTKDYQFKGFLLNFNKKTRELLNSIWLDTGEVVWKKIVIAS